jgi:ABC-type multidrug transport system ATPase subunit
VRLDSRPSLRRTETKNSNSKGVDTKSPGSIIDEATSALDREFESVVQDTLEKAATGTTIAMAHRLSVVKRADVIFVLEDGKVAESGNHDILMDLGEGTVSCGVSNRPKEKNKRFRSTKPEERKRPACPLWSWTINLF